MSSGQFYYLVYFQYLGFRYHGWQRQPQVKTVQEMVERTCRYILEHDKFKVLAAGRTDAKVSVERGAFELFLEKEVDTAWLESALNKNLPNDIRVLAVEETGPEFNIIQSPRHKEYVYLFSCGQKNHPFCAPLMVYMEESLDIAAMQEAAELFEGEHDFTAFSHKPGSETETTRKVLASEIIPNEMYQASFFPDVSWVYRVLGPGFLRHQIRLMMGALFAVGSGNISPQVISSALRGEVREPVAFMAPQSGLILRDIQFS